MFGNVHGVNSSACSEVRNPRLPPPPLKAHWARAQTVTPAPLSASRPHAQHAGHRGTPQSYQL